MGPAKALSAGLRKSPGFSGRATAGKFWRTWGMLCAASGMILMHRGMPGLGETIRNWATILPCILAPPLKSAGNRRQKDAGIWRRWCARTFLIGQSAPKFCFKKPNRAERQAWQLGGERADKQVWLAGNLLHTILQKSADALPWIGRPLTLPCQVLALFPARYSEPNAIISKVTP